MIIAKPYGALMSHFPLALAATLAHEGGYVNDPADRGGETYRGISRKHHPDWPGWERVDFLKPTVMTGFIERDSVLALAVEAFYRERFWQPIGGDALTDLALACALFDCGVNLGVKKAVWFLQRSLNALSKNGSVSGIIEPDRRWGPATARALKAQLAAKGGAAIIKMIDGIRTVHYLNMIERDPTQGRFAYGWLARVGRAG